MPDIAVQHDGVQANLEAPVQADLVDHENLDNGGQVQVGAPVLNEPHIINESQAVGQVNL